MSIFFLLFSKVVLYLKKEWLILSLFILIISISQSIILKPHLEFAFSPDDVWLFSDFRALGNNPFSQLPQVWRNYGSHATNPLYYNGILFSFFGFNYQAYQIAALIFKILSIISFYLLINAIFKNRLLAFLSGLIFSFHFASIGGLEMVTRTQDYLVITGMNIFLIFFYFISTKKLTNILWKALAGLILFSTFFINPIRAFPLIPFICFLSLLIYLKDKNSANLSFIVKNLFIYALPFITFMAAMRGSSDLSFGNFSENLKRILTGNFQFTLTPIATLGSIILSENGLKFLRFEFEAWNFNNFFNYLLLGPTVIFGLITFVLSKILSKKPIQFFLYVFITNFAFEVLYFLIVRKILNLPSEVQIPYAFAFLGPPTLLGFYIISLIIFIFVEWLQNKHNTYLSLSLLGISFTITFIWLTWVFQDFQSTPLGIHGYTNIPVMGISAVMGSILMLAYIKLKGLNGSHKYFNKLIFLVLIPYFLFSYNQIQLVFAKHLTNGNNAKDQIYLKNKFWQLVKVSDSCNKFFYADTKDDPKNGYFYGFTMLDRFDKWYNLYGSFNDKTPCSVAILVNDKEKLLSSYTLSGDKVGFFYPDYRGINRFYPLEDFYAFKLQNRDITDIKAQILEKLANPKPIVN